jgi:hypothetical protein
MEDCLTSHAGGIGGRGSGRAHHNLVRTRRTIWKYSHADRYTYALASYGYAYLDADTDSHTYCNPHTPSRIAMAMDF